MINLIVHSYNSYNKLKQAYIVLSLLHGLKTYKTGTYTKLSRAGEPSAGIIHSMRTCGPLSFLPNFLSLASLAISHVSLSFSVSQRPDGGGSGRGHTLPSAKSSQRGGSGMGGSGGGRALPSTRSSGRGGCGGCSGLQGYSKRAKGGSPLLSMQRWRQVWRRTPAAGVEKDADYDRVFDVLDVHVFMYILDFYLFL